MPLREGLETKISNRKFEEMTFAAEADGSENTKGVFDFRQARDRRTLATPGCTKKELATLTFPSAPSKTIKHAYFM